MNNEVLTNNHNYTVIKNTILDRDITSKVNFIKVKSGTDLGQAKYISVIGIVEIVNTHINAYK